MKITKRLSLSSMITERYNGPLPHDFLMKRIYFAKYQDQPLAVSEELVKNGYTMKPKLTPLSFWVMVGGMALGSCFYFYLQNLRRNELQVRNKYRIVEKEQPAVLLLLRNRLLEFGQNFFEYNLFMAELVNRNSGKKLDKSSQGLIRLKQYRHYMTNKDSKFDFMDLGVMEKFPFPQIE